MSEIELTELNQFNSNGTYARKSKESKQLIKIFSHLPNYYNLNVVPKMPVIASIFLVNDLNEQISSQNLADPLIQKPVLECSLGLKYEI